MKVENGAKSLRKMSNQQFIYKPCEISRDKRLTPVERDYLCLIAALQNAKGCTASNNWFATYFGVKRQTAQEIIGRLKDKNIIACKEQKQGGKTIKRTIEIIDSNSRKLLLIDSRENLPKIPAGLAGSSDKVSRKLPTHITKDITKENSSVSSTTDGSDFVSLWNSKDRLPKIKALTDKRREALKVRMEEKQFAENLPLIIEKVACSDFLCGLNDRKWRADIDWLLKNDTNYVKILEGKYDNKIQTATATAPLVRDKDGKTPREKELAKLGVKV